MKRSGPVITSLPGVLPSLHSYLDLQHNENMMVNKQLSPSKSHKKEFKRKGEKNHPKLKIFVQFQSNRKLNYFKEKCYEEMKYV